MRDDGKQLLKVELSSRGEKRDILRRSRHLKKGKFSSIFISEDLTPRQQEQIRIMRRELKLRRENGENVVIFKGKVTPMVDVKHFH